MCIVHCATSIIFVDCPKVLDIFELSQFLFLILLFRQENQMFSFWAAVTTVWVMSILACAICVQVQHSLQFTLHLLSSVKKINLFSQWENERENANNNQNLYVYYMKISCYKTYHNKMFLLVIVIVVFFAEKYFPKASF